MKTKIKLIKPFISGSVLKLIAMITMLIDHLAAFVLCDIDFFTNPFVTIFGKAFTIYTICRKIGRIAFPLYCFLLAEGFIHTKNRKKYGIRLFIFALISELPWNFIHSGGLLYPSQNIMFTLFFGYLALCAVEYFDKAVLKQAAALIILFFVCLFGRIDYGIRGLGLILVIYLLRNKPAAQAIAGACMVNNSLYAGLAFIPINLYNKERGFMKGSFWKYTAYLFYPVHILILGIIKYCLI